MAINVPWSAFGFESEEEKDKRLRAEQSQAVGGLLGESITSEMSGASMEFDELGQPINVRQQAPTMYDRQGTGFLGSDRGIGAQMALGAGLQTTGGLTAPQAQQVMSPQTRLDAAQYAAMSKQNEDMVNKKGNYKTFKDFASGIANLSDRQAKALQPWKASVKDYENISALYETSGRDMSKGKLGAFDIALQRGFMKSLSAMRPENYMNDDALAIAANTMGVGSVEGVINYLKGEGTLDKESREALLKAFRSIMETNYESMADEQLRFDRQAEMFFPETAKEDIFGRTSKTYDPSLTTGAAPTKKPQSQSLADEMFGKKAPPPDMTDEQFLKWYRENN